MKSDLTSLFLCELKGHLHSTDIDIEKYLILPPGPAVPILDCVVLYPVLGRPSGPMSSVGVMY